MNDFEYFVSTLPDNQKSSEKYNVRRYWELNGKPKDFNEAVNLGMYTLGDDGYYHANSVAYNQKNNTYEFMKDPSHDTLWMEIDSYLNNPDMKQFRNDYILNYTTSPITYQPRPKNEQRSYIGIPPRSVIEHSVLMGPAKFILKYQFRQNGGTIDYLNLFK